MCTKSVRNLIKGQKGKIVRKMLNGMQSNHKYPFKCSIMYVLKLWGLVLTNLYCSAVYTVNPGLLPALEAIYVPNSRPLAESAITGVGRSCQHGREFVTLK